MKPTYALLRKERTGILRLIVRSFFVKLAPGHVHLCMGAYGEHSSRLRNFEGFKLVTNMKETKEAKCNYLSRAAISA